MAETSRLNELKELVGISSEDSSQNGRLLFALDYARCAVKNYCRIDNIPVELRGVEIMLARDLFSAYGIYGITALKEGDVRFEFDKAKFDEGSIIKAYHHQLDLFRKTVW